MTVELPKDAEGREIPLDTALLYGKVSGEEYEVVCFNFRPSMRQWRVELKRRDDLGIYATERFTLSQPDSWEKLEDDLGKIANNPGEVVCAYFGREISDCDGCKLESCECACSNAFLRDVIERIRKLRGDD